MLGEDKDSWLRNCDAEPFENDAWINDEYMETQVMDIECDNDDFLLCAETQTVDLGFEIGEEPIIEGKSLLDASDGLATQVLDHFDDEVVLDSDDDNVTDVLDDNCELSDSDDSCTKAETLLSSEENRQDGNEKSKQTTDLDARSNEHGISGEFPVRFADFVNVFMIYYCPFLASSFRFTSCLKFRVGYLVIVCVFVGSKCLDFTLVG